MIGRITIAALALLSASTFFTQEKAGSGSNINYETMRKDLETMRRILAQDIRGSSRTLSSGGNFQLDDLTFYSSEGSSDAAYVAGIGALFTARVNMALVGPSQADEVKDVKPPSRWDDVRAEVDGKEVSVWRVRLARDFDQKAVDALRDRVVTSLGNFGAKIGQLSDDQSILVVLRSSNSGRYTSTRRAPEALSGGVTINEAPAADAAKAELEADLVNARGFTTLSSIGYAVASGSVMSMSVSVADCKAMRDGAMKIEDFMRRAKVAQY